MTLSELWALNRTAVVVAAILIGAGLVGCAGPGDRELFPEYMPSFACGHESYTTRSPSLLFTPALYPEGATRDGYIAPLDLQYRGRRAAPGRYSEPEVTDYVEYYRDVQGDRFDRYLYRRFEFYRSGTQVK